MPAPSPERRAAAFARIRQYGDPVLRTPTTGVERFDDDLGRLVADLTAVLTDVDGAGLAAPQIGSLQRVLVYRAGRDDEVRALVNPRITVADGGTHRDLEGCLSLGRAAVHVAVERPVHVRVEAFDVDGTPVEIEAQGRHARILQHEIDHLDGVLMLQRIEREQRRLATRALLDGAAWSAEGTEWLPAAEPDAEAGRGAAAAQSTSQPK